MINSRLNWYLGPSKDKPFGILIHFFDVLNLSRFFGGLNFSAYFGGAYQSWRTVWGLYWIQNLKTILNIFFGVSSIGKQQSMFSKVLNCFVIKTYRRMLQNLHFFSRHHELWPCYRRYEFFDWIFFFSDVESSGIHANFSSQSHIWR